MENNIKSAREMFEELGYEQRNHENILRYTLKRFISDWYHIDFDKKEKSIYTRITFDSPFTNDEPFEISLEEFKAINKQVEELRWLDENNK